MDLADTIGPIVGAVTMFALVYNLCVFDRTQKDTRRSSPKMYEEFCRRGSRRSKEDRFRFYLGMPGRFLAYKFPLRKK